VADLFVADTAACLAGADWLWSAELAATVLQEGGRLSGVCPQPYGYNPSSSSRGPALDPGSFTTMLSALMTARTAATAAGSLYELAGAWSVRQSHKCCFVLQCKALGDLLTALVSTPAMAVCCYAYSSTRHSS
jgi:hypothetical protein